MRKFYDFFFVNAFYETMVYLTYFILFVVRLTTAPHVDNIRLYACLPMFILIFLYFLGPLLFDVIPPCTFTTKHDISDRHMLEHGKHVNNFFFKDRCGENGDYGPRPTREY